MARASLSQLLTDLHTGVPGAGPQLFAHLYADLCRLARHICRSAPAGALPPTALVHEAYLHLAPLDDHRVATRTHFVRLVARAMRQVLAREHRRRHAQKRGPDRVVVSLSDLEVGRSEPVFVRLTLAQALETLRRRQPRTGRVVDCRLLRGLTIDETAHELNVSPATVKRDWRAARTWLRAYLTPSPNKKSDRPPEGDRPLLCVRHVPQ
jgi:RNA polymerase sigma factor (TIGR02999 family)